MSSANFDPYHKWLGIAPEDQPPNYYRLLAIPQFEADPDVISNATDKQMTFIRTFQSSQHAAESQRILNEIAAVRVTLLNPAKKAAYDAALREKVPSAPPAVHVPPVVQEAPTPSFDFDMPRSAPRPKPKPKYNPVAVVAIVAALCLVIVSLVVWAIRGPTNKVEQVAVAEKTVQTEPKAQPKVEPKPEPKTEPRIKPMRELQPEPKAEPRPDPVVPKVEVPIPKIEVPAPKVEEPKSEIEEPAKVMEKESPGEESPEDTKDKVKRTAKKNNWTVIFRSSDPSIWNTESNDESRFAVPLAQVPPGIKFLRLTRMDTKEYIIVPITKVGLGDLTNDGRYGWNGRCTFFANTRQLGIYDGQAGGPGDRSPIGQLNTLHEHGKFGFGGWGFGVNNGAGDKQYYGWAGKVIPETVFEIAAKTTALTPAESQHLLSVRGRKR